MTFANAEELSKITFKIKCGDQSGTCFLTPKGLLLTAWHVVAENDDATQIQVRIGDEYYPGELIDWDISLDVALIKVEQSLPVSTVLLLKSPVIIGQSWYAFGFPSSESLNLVGDTETGKVKRDVVDSSVSIFDIGLDCKNFSPQFIYTGYSGSPVITPQGVIIAMLNKKLNTGLGAVSIQKISSFLEKNQVSFNTDHEKYNDYCFGPLWFNKLGKKIIAYAGPRYSPLLNIELPIDQNIDALTADHRFFENLRTLLSKVKSQLELLLRDEDMGQKLEPVSGRLTEILEKLIRPRLPIGSGADIENLGVEVQGIAEQLRTVYSDLYRESQKTAASPGERSRSQFDSQLYYLNNLISSVSNLVTFLEGDLFKLYLSPRILLTGPAGQGKTHLLSDVTIKRIEEGIPSFMFFGQHFTQGSIWDQMLGRLALNMSSTEFLTEINEIGQNLKKRVLIAIDALNEGAGRLLWQDGLRELLVDLEPYPWIVLAISIRSPFDEIIIPKDLLTSKQLIKVNHPGFKGREFEAMMRYFEFYHIELQSVAPLDPEFGNPLFLRIFCEGLAYKKMSRLPKGWQKFTAVFNTHLEHKNQLISNIIDVDPKRNIVFTVLKKLSKELLYQKKRYLSRDQVNELCEETFPSGAWSRSLLNHLISESVLLESVIIERSGEQIDTIEFNYERFSDFFKAEYLSGYFNHQDVDLTIGPLAEIFKKQNLSAYRNVIDSLSILIPEKFGKELYEYFIDLAQDSAIVKSYLNSLLWRSYESINIDKTGSYFDLVISIENGNYKYLLNILLMLGTDPYHPFNSEYLHGYLMGFESIAERDAAWSVFIHFWYNRRIGEDASTERTVVHSYINWASTEFKKSLIDESALLLTATVLTWFLSSSNRFLRDDATKALISLFKDNPVAVLGLLDKFETVNDPYISERLYAVCYGIVMSTNDEQTLRTIGLHVYDKVFKAGQPPVHILQRDYARNCVERAIYFIKDLPVDAAKIRPPYYSKWLEAPALSEVEVYDVKRPDDRPYTYLEIAQSHLYSSVMGFEDFARYVIGTNSSSNWSALRMRGYRYYKELKKELKGKAKTKLLDLETSVHLAATLKVMEGYPSKSRIANPDSLADLNKKIVKYLTELSEIVQADQLALIIDEFIPHVKYTAIMKLNKSQKVNKFDLSQLQRLIIQKVYQLGWTKENFGSFDRQVYSSSPSRSATKDERIGKKYQWIAYHEYLARIADNFYYAGMSQYNGYKNFEGPFQDSRERDIDPSILIKKVANKPLEVFKDTFSAIPISFEEGSDEEWLASSKDLPEVESIIQVIDNEGKKWLLLDAYLDWTEKLEFEDESFQVPRKQIWHHIKSYLVKRTDKNKFLSWGAKQDFMGRWMPEPAENYDYFLKESYWSPAYRISKKEDGVKVWIKPSHRTGKSSAPNVAVTAEKHLCEGGGFDCSIEETIGTTLPAELIAKSMDLRFTSRTGYLENSNKELIALDPSLYDNGPSGLLINQLAFQEFLDREQYDVVWTMLGEKRILGGNRASYKEFSISGVYHFDVNSEIIGTKNIRTNSQS